MTDTEKIEIAQTTLRDAYNNGDTQRVLTVFADGFTNMCDGQPSFWGLEARKALEIRLDQTFKRYDAQLAVIIIDIAVHDGIAIDHGWYKLKLKPKNAGKPIDIKYRYLEQWVKQADGDWKIGLIITNKELAPRMLEELEAPISVLA